MTTRQMSSFARFKRLDREILSYTKTHNASLPKLIQKANSALAKSCKKAEKTRKKEDVLALYYASKTLRAHIHISSLFNPCLISHMTYRKAIRETKKGIETIQRMKEAHPKTQQMIESMNFWLDHLKELHFKGTGVCKKITIHLDRIDRILHV